MARNYQRKDHYYQRAKDEGFSSRAAYKLEELDKKWSLFRPGSRVLDLGAWPGAWLEYAADRVGQTGLVVGVDLVEVGSSALQRPNVEFIKGSVECVELRADIAQGFGHFDVVMSDMSAKLTGVRFRDSAMSGRLLEAALAIAMQTLKTKGVFVAKFFPGQDCEDAIKSIREILGPVRRIALKTSRKTSKEMYLRSVRESLPRVS